MFCRTVTPGAAQMLQCLQDHSTESGFPMSCKKAVTMDLQASNQDYRMKRGIAASCKTEIDTHCKDKKIVGQGQVLSCLKEHWDEITAPSCKAELRRFVQQGVENIELSPATATKCKDDITNFCKDVTPGQGRVHQCLLEHQQQLSEVCAKAEFRVQEIQSKDISTNRMTLAKCTSSINKICKDTKPGTGRMWQCLEEKINDQDMADDCRQEVQKFLRLKHSNFFLNPHFSKDCDEDARKLCPKQFAKASFRAFNSRGSLTTCLIDHREQVNNTDCKADLWKKEKERVAENMLDPAMQQACESDVESQCADYKMQGHGMVQKCLHGKVGKLSKPCNDKVEAYLVLASEDMRFQEELTRTCMAPLKQFCPQIQAGRGRWVSCLIDHMHSVEMDPSCRVHLVEEEMWRSRGLEFNPALKAQCQSDLRTLLTEQKCGNPGVQGWKINCLTRHTEELKAPGCLKSVRETMQRQSADVRAKPGMAQACADDSKELCPGIEAGGARLQTCLREKQAKIKNNVCLSMVQEVETVDKGSASLNYNVRKNCYNERQTFCKGIEAGDSRILACLSSHVKDEGFSTGCLQSMNLTSMREALNKHPLQFGMDTLKEYVENHRSFVDKWGVLLLGGTVGFVIIMGFVISYFIIQKRLWNGAYSMVVPRDLES